MGLLPDEAKVLPPPGIINRNSAWLGLTGWVAAMIQNSLNRRPAIKAGLDSTWYYLYFFWYPLHQGSKRAKPIPKGVHRQALFITIGWFIGYHLTKIENYKYAKLDREMKEYIRLHPVEFPEMEKKTFAEIVEPFHPIR